MADERLDLTRLNELADEPCLPLMDDGPYLRSVGRALAYALAELTHLRRLNEQLTVIAMRWRASGITSLESFGDELLAALSPATPQAPKGEADAD